MHLVICKSCFARRKLSKCYKSAAFALAFLLFLWIVCQWVTHDCPNFKPRIISKVRGRASHLLELVKRNSSKTAWRGKKCMLSQTRERPMRYLPLSYLFKSEATLTSFPNGLPKIVHTTWKTRFLREAWKEASTDCRFINDGFVFCHWTDNDLDMFVAAEYPELLETYLLYPYSIQRADLGRYLLLHKFGGFYRDVNIGCEVPLEHLYLNESSKHRRRTNYFSSRSIPFKVLLIEGNPFGKAGDFLASVPGHLFFGHIIEQLKHRPSRYGLPYLDVMLGTGPLFLGEAYSSFVEDLSVKESIKDEILVMRDYGNYFYFIEGGTWHCKDGKFMWWLFQKKVTVVVVVLVLLVVFFVCKLRLNRLLRILSRIAVNLFVVFFSAVNCS